MTIIGYRNKVSTGDKVTYKGKEYLIEGPSADVPPGLIFKSTDPKKKFSFSMTAPTAVAAGFMEPIMAPTPPAPTPTPGPTPTSAPKTPFWKKGKTPPTPGPSPPAPAPTPTSPPKPPKIGGGSGFWDTLKNTNFGGGTSSRWFGKSDESASTSFLFKLLFIIALVVQFFDWKIGYQRPGFMIYSLIVLLVIAFFVYDMTFGQELASFAVILIAAYFLPYLGSIMPDSKFTLLVNGLLFYMPVIVLYLGVHSPKGSWPRITAIIILMILLISALFSLTASFAPDMNSKTLVKDPMAGVKYLTSGIIKSFTTAFNSIGNSVRRAIAQATGEPYDGEEESRVGIYLEDVKSLESKYNANTPVYVEAKIKAYNVKESINVNTICYIDGLSPGIVSPTMIYGITDNYENTIGCDLGKLLPGTYTVKVRINFEFETSSDIEYTFVNSDIKSDQYERLDIDTQTMATYTGGPVELGLPSLTQPLRIEVDPKINSQLSTYPFGVSLKNLWPQGKVVRGKRYMLNVPSEVSLIDCSREAIPSEESGLNIDRRNIYVFAINQSNAGDMFDAVRCRMSFDNVKSLLGNDLKSVKTFAARARYEYAVEGSTVINVDTS